MPAYMVHRIAGDKVLMLLDKKTVFEINAYITGLQGPDIFFYHNYSLKKRKNNSLKFGSLLHSVKIKEFFEKSMKYIKDCTCGDRNYLISYFCGYIVHYCVDKTLHPFVFERAHDITSHNNLEFMLDAWYAKDEMGLNVYDFDVGADFNREKLKDAVGIWYETMDKHLYGYGISKKIPVAAQHNFKRFRKILGNPSFIFYIFSFLYKHITGADPKMFVYPKRISEYYFSKDDYKYLKTLIDKAVKKAAAKIKAFNAYLKDKRSLEDVMRLYENVDFKGQKI